MEDLSIKGNSIFYGSEPATIGLPEGIASVGVMPMRFWLVDREGQLYSTNLEGRDLQVHKRWRLERNKPEEFDAHPA